MDKYDAFISFSFKDQDIVENVVNELENKYGISCWTCLEYVKSGQSYKELIPNAIKNSCVTVVFISKDSVVSTEVPKEVGIALKREKTVIPFLLDNSEYQGKLEYDLEGVNYIDATKEPFEERIKDLAKAIYFACGRTFDFPDVSENILNFMSIEKEHFDVIKKAASECVQKQRDLIIQTDLKDMKEIKRLYEEVLPIAQKYLVETKIIYDYVLFIDSIEKDWWGFPGEYEAAKKDMLAWGKELYEIYSTNPELCTIYSIYDICSIVADNLQDDTELADFYYEKAKKSVLEYLNRFKDKSSLEYAQECMNAADLPIFDDIKTIELYNQAISTLEKLEQTPRVIERLKFCKEQIKL